MTAGYLLILFLPDRTTPGTLATVLRKHPIQYVEGCVESAVRARFATRRGVLLTVVDWAPDAIARPKRGAVRIELPDTVIELLHEIGDSVSAPFDCAVIEPGGPLAYHADIDLARLDRPIAMGCRYTVRLAPPGRPTARREDP